MLMHDNGMSNEQFEDKNMLNTCSDIDSSLSTLNYNTNISKSGNSHLSRLIDSFVKSKEAAKTASSSMGRLVTLKQRLINNREKSR